LIYFYNTGEEKKYKTKIEIFNEFHNTDDHLPALDLFQVIVHEEEFSPQMVMDIEMYLNDWLIN
jgi:trimethylamine:corrinoid methyltransferase-like protein